MEKRCKLVIINLFIFKKIIFLILIYYFEKKILLMNLFIKWNNYYSNFVQKKYINFESSYIYINT